MDSFEDAEAALARIAAGEADLDDFGERVGTPLVARDDHEFPTYHPWLFDAALGEGDLLPVPVFLADTVLVGRVKEDRAGPPRAVGRPGGPCTARRRGAPATSRCGP